MGLQKKKPFKLHLLGEFIMIDSLFVWVFQHTGR